MDRRNYVFIAKSLDGYIADRNGGLDWLHSIPNPDQLDMGYLELINQVDALVMGRVTFETVCSASTPSTFGGNGAFTHTVASASDGLSFFFTGGATFNNGAELVLYGLRK